MKVDNKAMIDNILNKMIDDYNLSREKLVSLQNESDFMHDKIRNFKYQDAEDYTTDKDNLDTILLGIQLEQKELAGYKRAIDFVETMW